MGQSILRKHTINGTRYASYGYFSVLGEDDLSMPLAGSNPAHRQIIENFKRDFQISFRNKRGLSVVVPFPRIASPDDADAEGANAEQIIEAVIHNYFYPIVNGWLEVIVEPDGHKPTLLTINANTI